MAMEKIPTNQGMMGVNSIFDHLTYVSYATQRDQGMTPERLKNLFSPSQVERFEKTYQNETNGKKH